MRDPRLDALLGWARTRASEAVERAPRLGVKAYVTRRPGTGAVSDWRDLGAVPRADERHLPQGLAWDGEDLWMTDHRYNARSHLYRVDPETGETSVDARLPAGILHPGGLALHEGTLWLVDYVSMQLLEIDPKTTLATGQVEVLGEHPTGLEAASGLTVFTLDGIGYLAVSDYLWRLQTTPPRPDGSARTYVVPLASVDALGEATVPELATLSYDNGGFSQGLAWTGDVLLEACNNLGIDRVEVLDVRDAIRGSDPSLIRRLGSFAGPAMMIEDLATDGTRLWTMDEGTRRLYERERIPTGRA